MFMFACFGRFFFKNCVVHSSSFSYLLSASFGPAGPILVASSLGFFFSSCIRSALVSDGGSLLFCKLRIAPSSICILAYLGDFSFSLLCCFVLSIRYPYAFSFILSHLSFPSNGLQLGMFFFASVIIFNVSLLASWVYSISVFILLFPIFFCFSILRVDPLLLPLEYGPSPRSLRMYGLAYVSATLVGYLCLLHIFCLILFLFQRSL